MSRVRRNRSKEDLKDLGFGSRVTKETGLRLLNRDGTFNVKRTGLSFWQSLNVYHALLAMSWWRFYLTIAILFVVINMSFAGLYIGLGISIKGSEGAAVGQQFLDAFFFSVQTFTTVGYGHLTPSGLTSNIIASLDALVGLMSFALATGLLFARFSRPTANIVFSHEALIAPFQDGQAFEFRLANARSNQLVNVEARVLFSRMSGAGAERRRRFFNLTLVRDRVVFLPLHWVVVHTIDEQSPLRDCTSEELEKDDAEFLVLLTAFDETFSQTVHARTSYKWHEVVWNASFRDIFREPEDGMVNVDLTVLHDYELQKD